MYIICIDNTYKTIIFNNYLKCLRRDEKAEQSFNASRTGSKEPAPKDPGLEAVKTNQPIKHEVGEGKTGFNVRNQIIIHFVIISNFIKKSRIYVPEEIYKTLIKLDELFIQRFV